MIGDCGDSKLEEGKGGGAFCVRGEGRGREGWLVLLGLLEGGG